MEDKRNILKEEQPFSFQLIKGDKARIFWQGKQVMIASGKPYNRLVLLDAKQDNYQMQLFLAKLTGHFKHGNER